MTDNKKKINDDELENVSGGYLFNQSNCPGGGANVWEVIDNKTGEVLYETGDKNKAIKACKEVGLETDELEYWQLGHLRQSGAIPNLSTKLKRNSFRIGGH